MGQTSSTQTHNLSSKNEEKDLESQASSSISLPFLQHFFSIFSDPSSNSIPLSSLLQCFSLKYTTITCEGATLPDCFLGILDQISSSITDTLFVPQKGGLTWLEFLRGYVKCCGRMSTSSQLNVLFRVLALSFDRAGCPINLHFDSDEIDSKISGSISPRDLAIIIWVCWIMSWNSKTPKKAMGSERVNIPYLNHLVLSAVISCAENGSNVDVWDTNVLDLEVELTIGKIHMWVIRTVPHLAECFSNFVSSRFKDATFEPSGTDTSSTNTEETSCEKDSEFHLLTSGRAWAISLSQRIISEEMSKLCFRDSNDVLEDSLLYRSYAHGKGMNRFWSNVEGYHGPVLLLISATFSESSDNPRKWIIGALTVQGFENRDVFYGSGGFLYSIYPVFQVFSASGSEQNYVYSHLHPAVKAYDPHPKPVGLAFGGKLGNERIFIDEDFAKITIRHHAVDKTYQHGSLIPNQGYLPTEASILDVAAWGLGGKKSKEIQNSYKRREQLFTEQRRKIDLKTFASWDDSPEKMMMDMLGNPNAVGREER